MTLGEKQRKFTSMVARLVAHAYCLGFDFESPPPYHSTHKHNPPNPASCACAQ